MLIYTIFGLFVVQFFGGRSGANPKTFWKNISILKLQASGSSQIDFLNVLESVVQSTLGVQVSSTPQKQVFVYIDDGLFTGNTFRREVSNWILTSAPATFTLHAIFITSHSYGEYYARKQLTEVANNAKKTMTLRIWRSLTLEDRKSSINDSEVFRPTRIKGNPLVEKYAQTLKYPPVLRQLNAMPKSGIFKNPTSRDIFEWEMLCKGAQLLSQCITPKKALRPLGFSGLDILGFGTPFLTYRNCPNNAPLVFWWGDPAVKEGALAWYPLFPRKSKNQINVVSHAPDWFKTIDTDAENFPMMWEEAASDSLNSALSSLEFDYKNGLIIAPSDYGSRIIDSLDDLRTYLSEQYNEAWYANVPFEDGEAVFSDDSDSAVENAIETIEDELVLFGWEI